MTHFGNGKRRSRCARCGELDWLSGSPGDFERICEECWNEPSNLAHELYTDRLSYLPCTWEGAVRPMIERCEREHPDLLPMVISHVIINARMFRGAMIGGERVPNSELDCATWTDELFRSKWQPIYLRERNRLDAALAARARTRSRRRHLRSL